jgi:hypothetical protein
MPNLYKVMGVLHFRNKIEFSEGLPWNKVQLSERNEQLVLITLRLAVAGPSKCGCVSDMAIDRELHIDSEKEISIDVEYDNFLYYQ